MLSTIYEETRSRSYQLLSDGHLDLILDKCSDYWDGQELRRMTDTVSYHNDGTYLTLRNTN
jgi:hypothetical protein